MAWIESHQALGHHPKTLHLAEALGCSLPTAVGHLQFLWWWALDYAPDGRLKPGSQLTIARACEWRGKPDKFWQGLLEAGFVDDSGEGGRIHDWHDYAGRLVDKRRRDAERKRQGRMDTSAGLPAPPNENGTGHPADGARTAQVPDLTVPDQPDQPTGPDRTGPIPPNPPSDPPKGGDDSETCPECELLVDRNGAGHGLSKLPGRVRNCSLDHLKPFEWQQRAAVEAASV
jgi:hypothetical protein